MAKILETKILGNVNLSQVMNNLRRQDEDIDANYRNNKSQRF